MNPLDGKFDFNYGDNINKKKFSIDNAESVILNNQFLKRTSADWYSKSYRYGWIDPFDNDRVTREYLFFTKPDLNIRAGTEPEDNQEDRIKLYSPIIAEVIERQPQIITQLQQDIPNPDGNIGPFMYLLSNGVTSKLELPGINSDSHESTSNLMGTSIQYRGHSFKSDNGYDFSLSFMDTAYLEIYALAKVYDEYIRLCKKGIARPKLKYITNHITSDQFSIYKFLIGSDGETILYYAKLTGCYITDVPRSDLADPSDEGIKFSLSFHANYIEDMNPNILAEFNIVANTAKYNALTPTIPVYDSEVGVNNQWARLPIIKRIGKIPRANRRHVTYDYYLKWYE